MSVAAQARPFASAGRRIRPRLRPTETGLLCLVAVALVVGASSLGATERLIALPPLTTEVLFYASREAIRSSRSVSLSPSTWVRASSTVFFATS